MLKRSATGIGTAIVRIIGVTLIALTVTLIDRIADLMVIAVPT